MNLRDFLSFSLLAVLIYANYDNWQRFAFFCSYLLIFSFALTYRNIQNRRQHKFISQIKTNKKILYSGGSAIIDEKLITLNSKLHTYQTNVGGLFTNVTIKSNFESGNVDDHRTPFLFSIITLITGWWSFPDGPIATLHILKLNSQGGETTTAKKILESIDDH